jgi:hypothetical protein
MTWACRGCGASEGYQPFAGVKAVEFWIRDRSSPGTVPNVKVMIGNPNLNKWCNNEIGLRGLPAAATEGEWQKFDIAVSAFNCPDQAAASQIGFQPNEQVNFCIDDLQLVR